MTNTIEIGHAKNIANFQNLITFVSGEATPYNLTQNALVCSGLKTLAQNAQIALEEAIGHTASYKNAVKDHQLTFDKLYSLCIRLINDFEKNGISHEKIETAQKYIPKIRQEYSTAILNAAVSNNFSFSVIITSQNLMEYVSELCDIIKSELTFNTALHVPALTAMIEEMNEKNITLLTAYTATSNAQITLNKILYQSDDCLVEIAKEVKSYIKSFFGAKSVEYAQISNIPFQTASGH